MRWKMPYNNFDKVCSSAGYHENVESYNGWFGTRYRNIPSFFTPYQTKTEALVATGDLLMKPLINAALACLSPIIAVAELFNVNCSFLEKGCCFGVLLLGTVSAAINTLCIFAICTLSLITRSLSTLVDEVSKLTSSSINQEVSSHNQAIGEADEDGVFDLDGIEDLGTGYRNF